MDNGTLLRQLICKTWIAVSLALLITGVLHAQQVGISHGDYLKAIGWEDDHIVMTNILRNGLKQQVEDKPQSFYEENARFFSMVLLLSGVKPQDYYKLQENGIDVIHAITADVRPFDEQALLSDLAVVGHVLEISEDSSMDDGFARTIKVKINEVLRGSVQVDTVQIRERAYSAMTGTDIRPEVNKSYLFLLSSGMYGYHKANYQLRKNSEAVVTAPQFGKEEVFLIYRNYPFINGELFYSPQNREAAFDALERLEKLLSPQ